MHVFCSVNVLEYISINPLQIVLKELYLLINFVNFKAIYENVFSEITFAVPFLADYNYL